MKLRTTITAIAISGLWATSVWSADYNVERTLQLSSSSTEVWNLIGDFCDVDDWHPDLVACSLNVIDSGLHRSVISVDGAAYLEKRISVEPGLSYTYRIIDSPLPIENFTATFSIEPLDGSLVSWSARFSSDDPTMANTISAFIENGMSEIESKLAE